MRVADLPTPALVVDTTALTRNLDTMTAALLGDRLRPHVKAHKCTALAREQANRGHTGFTGATPRELLGLAAAGLGADLLLANETVDDARLRALANCGARVTVAVDSPETVDAAARNGIGEVLIDINVGIPRCGVRADDAAAIADLARARALTVRGTMGYEGHAVLVADRTERTALTDTSMALLARAHEAVGGEILSGGGTGTYDVNEIATEIQAGSYALMDTAYAKLGIPFDLALAVVATVIHANPKWTVADCGLKALGMDHGNPTITDADVMFCSDEHITFVPHTPARVGDRVLVWPAHVDPTVAYHREMHLADGPGIDANVIDVWPIDLRGWDAEIGPGYGRGVTDLSKLDATAQAELVRSGAASPIELVDAAIARIEKLNDELNAVIHPLFDRARAEANSGMPEGPFRGVPILVKDLDGTLAGEPYHGGNKLLKELDYKPHFTSYLFSKLEEAGFVIVGKTNTPELGLMPSAEPLAYGPTHNPWDTAHSAGGSSGGSAAAVAAGLVPVAHAGDGGGSIRIPASACGIFGLKPSRGRVSLGPHESEPWGGLVMRHVVSRSVRDSAAILDVLEGYMPGDPNTAPLPAAGYAREVGADPGKLRIGVLTHAPGDLATTDPECIAAVGEAASLLESLGHKIEDSAPSALAESGLMDQFSAVMMSSLRADLDDIAKIAGRPLTADDVEPMTWLFYETSAGVDGGAYVTALHEMHRWTRRVTSWWFDQGFDLLLTPTLAEPPPVLGDVGRQDDGGLNAAARSIPFAAYTAPFNVTGQPAMSVPLHWSEGGLPIGVQLVAAPFREDLLFRVAAQLEQARPWADRRPPVHA